MLRSAPYAEQDRERQDDREVTRRTKLYKELSRMSGEAGPETLSQEVIRLRRRLTATAGPPHQAVRSGT